MVNRALKNVIKNIRLIKWQYGDIRGIRYQFSSFIRT